MSEWNRITDNLERQFTFRNTFYHTEPKFDVLSLGPEHEHAYDFIITSEVFEHVPPPVEPAFANLARALKPDGFVVFSVPWRPDGHTVEHFPELYDWELVKLKSSFVLLNRTQSGELQAFEDLVFHGGIGQTLEMRIFSRNDLLKYFEQAGFEDVEISEVEPCLEFGIRWPTGSHGLVARKRRGVRVPITPSKRISYKKPADVLSYAMRRLGLL
jgi:SAM-dependent methyltransferase